MKTLQERFDEKYIPEPNSGCWLWISNQRKGYGEMYINTKRIPAHRVSWTIHYGEIPDGLLCLHTCDNPSCVNPVHLFLGTNSDNMKDKASKGRGYSPTGIKHHMNKLTEDDVLAIRDDARKQWEIAEDYGIAQSGISKIKSRETWSHL